MRLIVLLMLLLPSIAWSGEVISFKEVLKKKSCSSLLKQRSDHGDRSAQVLAFDQRNPDYMTSNLFMQEMKESGPDEFYLYSSDHVSFSRRSDGVWKPLPQIAKEESLYVLKVRAFDPVFKDMFGLKERWSVSELREHVRLLYFTRVRVSPFFPLIKSIIQQVRGIESHYRSSEYVAPRLMDEYAVIGSNLKVQLISYINSWTPTTTNEEAVKELMKSFIERSLQSLEERQALQEFDETMREFVEGLRFL